MTIEEQSNDSENTIKNSDYEQKSSIEQFKIPKREKRLLKDLFDWTESSVKSYYIFRSARI